MLVLAFAGCGDGVEGGGDERRPRVELVVQDDGLLLYHRPEEVRRSARTLAELGVDRVRLTAGWSAMAPFPDSPERPDFDATDPADYPQIGWKRLAIALREVRGAGLEPMVDVAFWAPRWAVERGAENPERDRWSPDPDEFGLFAGAVARRFDEVRLWTTWNEPNDRAFLAPQWVRRGGDWVAAAPHIYRAMHEAGYEAIKDANGDNLVLVGGLTSVGSTKRGPYESIPPLEFLRELACVDGRLRPLERPECEGFEPLRADGFAHHPYSFRLPPDRSHPQPGSAVMGELDELSRLLAGLHEAGRIERRLPVYITEFGYETDPPDPARGISLERQARYMNHAVKVAHDRPDVRMHAQFLLRDVEPRAFHQTGLLFSDFTPKPSFFAFPLPFWAERAGGGVEAFGQLRPGEGRRRVVVERADGQDWRAVTPSFSTDEHGVFRRRLEGAGSYRARAGELVSLPVRVR